MSWQFQCFTLQQQVWRSSLVAFVLSVGIVQGQSLPGSPTGGPPSGPASSAPPAAQTPTPAAAASQSSAPAPTASPALGSTDARAKAQAAREATAGDEAAADIASLTGLRIRTVKFEGVTFAPGDALVSQLAVKAGDKLAEVKVRESVRRLFATGLYRDIGVEGQREGGQVDLIFLGKPRYFVGRVVITGVKEDRLSSLLEYATELQPGTPYTEAALPAAVAGIKQTLASNGYYQPTIAPSTVIDQAGDQVNVTVAVAIGPQARIGQVSLEGTDPGLTTEQFRKKAKLKRRAKVTHDTTDTALTKIGAFYQKENRLEATASLQKQTYDAPRKELDYDFHASEGPLVNVVIDGVKVSKSRMKLLVPIFEEGTIDNDLMNEGSFNIKDFLFQQGYFDAKVAVKLEGAGTGSVRVVYSVNRGVKHKVLSVTIKGNHYFDSDLLKEHMQVQKADAYLRSGRYSPQLMKSDESSILGLYRANGFNKATITSSIKDVDESKSGKHFKVAEISVIVTITEGAQQKFGTVTLAGVEDSRKAAIKGLLNAQEGQPFSLITLSGDRDVILQYYVSHGFDKARAEVRQKIDTSDPTRTNVTLNITEGNQTFIRQVLLSGLSHVKPSVIEREVVVHPGDPLDQSALLQTQRNLYNLALFNEVVATEQNPSGDIPDKNVILQLTQARRWDVTYGFGFEAETGQPATGVINPASAILLGISPTQSYAQNGRTGVSPRVSIDVSRLNVRGGDQSLTLHGTYGLLEEVALATLQSPRFLNNPKLTQTISGGYSNVQNISTFQSSTLQGDYRVTQKVKRADTFIYNFEYRRVAVNPSTLQVSANLIPLLSQPVRVAGPGVTWFHDKRQPSPLDATKGSYTSVQQFFSSSKFGSQTTFSRTDVTNSTYYTFGKRKYTLARSTRLGFEASFGANPNAGNASCAGVLLTTNASCDAVPLPERLYAGGATSHRGFGINSAGPRDLQTGFPVGGEAVFINSIELRLPAPTLPVVGDSVSFVVFHDMGNVFQHVGDMFPSIARFHQPNQSTCANVSTAFGTCDFNYFSHAIGLGARYKTPVGPIRVDLSYNLNPPVYPVIYDFNGSAPYEGQAGHFNFFFSIGQSF